MKKTNKGFSMVELIIVIAIMAILAGALAPALIKYINKSRISTDISNGQQIASGIQTALSNEDAFSTVKETGTTASTFTAFMNANSGTDFATELTSVIGSIDGTIKSSKDAQSNSITDQNYYVKVITSSNTVEVYAAAADANHMIYPKVGSSWNAD